MARGSGSGKDNKSAWAWSGGVFLFVCLLGGGAFYLIERFYSGTDTMQLIKALSRDGPYLGVASTTASATTLALMLTLVGLMRRADENFPPRTYRAVGYVARLATASLAASLLLLLMIVFPVDDFSGLSGSWNLVLYRVYFALVVLAVALLAATIAMLYQTVHRVINTLAPGDD